MSETLAPTLTMSYAAFVAAIAPEAPQLPLYLCQGKPFALTPRLGAPVTCYVPAGTVADMIELTLDWAYLHWGNPPVSIVTVVDYPPESVAPTWYAHMVDASGEKGSDGSLP
jgi:hypothetical protein